MSKVYLAGPIANYDRQKAKAWRQEFTDLMPEHIQVFSPLRDAYDLPSTPYSGQGIFSRKSVTFNSMADVRQCDAMVINFEDAPNPSQGTLIELGWASAWNKSR